MNPHSNHPPIVYAEPTVGPPPMDRSVQVTGWLFTTCAALGALSGLAWAALRFLR